MVPHESCKALFALFSTKDEFIWRREGGRRTVSKEQNGTLLKYQGNTMRAITESLLSMPRSLFSYRKCQSPQFHFLWVVIGSIFAKKSPKALWMTQRDQMWRSMHWAIDRQLHFGRLPCVPSMFFIFRRKCTAGGPAISKLDPSVTGLGMISSVRGSVFKVRRKIHQVLFGNGSPIAVWHWW